MINNRDNLSFVVSFLISRLSIPVSQREKKIKQYDYDIKGFPSLLCCNNPVVMVMAFAPLYHPIGPTINYMTFARQTGENHAAHNYLQ